MLQQARQEITTLAEMVQTGQAGQCCKVHNAISFIFVGKLSRDL
jgi:hypothetical protein